MERVSPPLFYLSKDPSNSVAIFVRVFLAILTADSIKFEAVEQALLESGMKRLPKTTCSGGHVELLHETVNEPFAEEICRRIVLDPDVILALRRIVTSVVGELSDSAPQEHLSDADIARYMACSGTADEYLTCDKQRAHLVECKVCLQTTAAAARAVIKPFQS